MSFARLGTLTLGRLSVLGAAGPIIQLSSATITDAASVGDLVGTLSVANGSGSYAFTLTDDAGGLFALDGVDDTRLEVAAALTAGTESITVSADNGVDPPISRVFSIEVTAVFSPSLDFSDERNSQYVPVI